MSDPKNPLQAFSSYQVKHVLAAFKDTTVAESAQLSQLSGRVGEPVKGAPDSIHIINEYTDDVFLIPTVIWEWTKCGAISPRTTQLDGVIQVGDRTGGQFVTWLRNVVQSKFNCSLYHLTFSLKTYFIGTDRREDNPVDLVIHGNPLIFNLVELEDAMNVSGVGTLISMRFVGTYNSTAQMPTYKPIQSTLTHRDGGLANVKPEVYSPTGPEILPRATEDSTKFPGRVTRLNKIKAMKNLKELFEALEFDLNQQPEAHKRQVQDWLEQIRPEYIKKIDPPPEQQRGKALPLKFKIYLDQEYQKYQVDNRNLVFEQTEEDKNITGVNSVPFKMGVSIYDMIDVLMQYSSRVGEDLQLPLPYKHRVNISHIRRGDIIELHIKIKKIQVPYNTVSVDTGPNLGTPLKLKFKTGKTGDKGDITYFKTTINSAVGVVPLEMGDKRAVFGNRESITGERIPKNAGGTEYFKAMYSGLREFISPYLSNSREHFNAHSSIATPLEQGSDHEFTILGNPNIMSDFQRKPSDAKPLEGGGKYYMYPQPEIEPMYLKVEIYITTDADMGNDANKYFIKPYYFNNHYEIVKLRNFIEGGALTQTFIVRKTDDII